MFNVFKLMYIRWNKIYLIHISKYVSLEVFTETRYLESCVCMGVCECVCWPAHIDRCC